MQDRCGDPRQGGAVSVVPIWHACIAICPAKHRSLLLFTITKNYIALILQYVLLDVSSINFLQKHDFDHFDLILFKSLS